MRYVFGGILICFFVLFAIALATLQPTGRPGVTTLVWATDKNPARTKQIETFARMFPGLDAVIDPGDRTKLTVRCATGTGPDIIDLWDAGNMRTFDEQGILLDLTPYADQMGFSPQQTYPSLRDGLMVGGKQYRFPCNVWANCIVYNKRIFDEHGVPYPPADWDYDQFIAIARKIAQPLDNGVRHIAVINWNTDAMFYKDLLLGHGGRFFSPDGLVSQLDSPGSIAAASLYRDLMYRHRVMPTGAEAKGLSSQGGWGAGALNWFFTERGAMIAIGRWMTVLARNYPALKGQLGATALPRVGSRPSQGMVEGRATGVNVNSPHREEALKFLRYLASPEYGELIARDGDALPPNPAKARSGQDLVTDLVPDPAFHQPFIDAVQRGRPLDYSPFLEAGITLRWIKEAIERIENGAPAEPTMRALAGEINAQIRQNLQRRPELQRRYAEVTGQPYADDWWKHRKDH